MVKLLFSYCLLSALNRLGICIINMIYILPYMEAQLAMEHCLILKRTERPV